MTVWLAAFAVLALFAVVAGELSELPWRRRIVDARRSRLPAPEQRVEARR